MSDYRDFWAWSVKAEGLSDAFGFVLLTAMVVGLSAIPVILLAGL